MKNNRKMDEEDKIFMDALMTYAEQKGWIITFIDPPEGVSEDEKEIEAIFVARPDASVVISGILDDNGLNTTSLAKPKEDVG